MKVAAAIDIGGTNTVFGLVSQQGKILAQDAVPTKAFPEPGMLVAEVTGRIRKMLGSEDNLIGAGTGAPNGNYFKGTIEFAPNLSWEGIIPMADMVGNALDCRSVLTNDANAAAMGEMIFGAAKGINDFLFITLGTGLGSGIVSNGKLVYGHDGFAGEVGHVIMFPDGRPCGCGRSGCLETYCSATGIVNTYHGLRDPAQEEAITAKYIHDRWLQQEPEALEAFRFTGEILGLALANSVAYTSPSAIFLFGGLADAGEALFKPVRESFENNLLKIYQNKIRILPSGLPANDAALLGAASLVWG